MIEIIRPDYKDFKHSAKGSTWEDHKYIERIDGTYYYPDNYSGGRHLPGDSDDEIELTSNDVENLAREVIRGNFGNGQVRKDLLGENYEAVQKRVNEIIRSSIGQINVSEATSESIRKVEETAKNADNSNVHSGVDMDEVLSVYRNRDK